MNVLFSLVSEGYGFGIKSIPMAVATKTKAIAFSQKTSQDEFEKEVELIYINLLGVASWFGIQIEKARWEDKDQLLKNGWLPVEEFKRGSISRDMWFKWAEVIHKNYMQKVKPIWQKQHPNLAQEANGKKILALNLQKWISHSEDINAEKQSLETTTCKAIAGLMHTIKMFTSHFSKVNDLDKVAEMKELLNGMYVPGETEATHLYGVRGVKHEDFIPLAFAADATVTIASTWQWLVQVINPAMNMKIFCNTALADAKYTEDIQQAMAQFGYKHQYILFDESTDVAAIEREIREFLFYNEMY